MTKEEVYDIWRPSHSPWTPWVKPVLFSFMEDSLVLQSSDVNHSRLWDVPLESGRLILADLPTPEVVSVGMAVAQQGYRPVPVFNACPYPPYGHRLLPFRMAVNAASLMSALSNSAQALSHLKLRPSAPPAFLIHKDRRGSGRPPAGYFDNRSFLTASDFPSAAFLRESGISNIVIVQRKTAVAPDLRPTLLAWQTAGLEISFQEPWEIWRPQPKRLRSPFVLKFWWDQLRFRYGFPPSDNGAFGEWVRHAANS